MLATLKRPIGLAPWLLILLLTAASRHRCFCSGFSAGTPTSSSLAASSGKQFRLFKARYPLEGGPSQLRLHVAVIVQDMTGYMETKRNQSSGEDAAQDTSGRRAGGRKRTSNERDAKESRLVLFDFLPREPTALRTTAALLSGGDVAGSLRERSLRFLPRGSVCVAETNASLDDMRRFVNEYPDRLSLKSNSCETFVDAFVKYHAIVQY